MRRSFPRLGAVNAALVSVYFAPVWAGEGLRALSSPFYGFEDRIHASAAAYYRALLDLGLNGLLHASTALATAKFVIAIGFLAYLIDFARAVVVGRDVNRETLDTVLLLAVVALMFWIWPALASADPVLVRLHATQFLLLVSALFVITVERHIEERGAQAKAAARLLPAAAASATTAAMA